MSALRSAWDWLWQAAEAYLAVGWLLNLIVAACACLAALFAWGFLGGLLGALRKQGRRPWQGGLGSPSGDEGKEAESVSDPKPSPTSPVSQGILVMAIGALGAGMAIRDFYPSDHPYYLSQSLKRRVEPELRLFAFGGAFALGAAMVVVGRRSR